MNTPYNVILHMQYLIELARQRLIKSTQISKKHY